MEPKTVSQHTKDIQRRFFLALDECIRTGKISGLQPFTDKYGFPKDKYSRLRTHSKNPLKPCRYKFIDIDAIYYIVKDFGVSTDYLILGKGEMFKK